MCISVSLMFVYIYYWQYHFTVNVKTLAAVIVNSTFKKTSDFNFFYLSERKYMYVLDLSFACYHIIMVYLIVHFPLIQLC